MRAINILIKESDNTNNFMLLILLITRLVRS